MKRIFVCSPVVEKVLAKKLCRLVVDEGHAPFAPHLIYPQFLDDIFPRQRAAGIASGIAWLGQADEMWVFSPDLDLCSEGMRAEVLRSEKFSIPPKLVWLPKCWAALWLEYEALSPEPLEATA